MFGSLPVAQRAGVTVVRMLLNYFMRPVSANLDIFVDTGILMVTSDALAVPAVPDPDQAEFPGWYFWRSQHLYGAVDQVKEFDFDIRTKRKIPGPNQGLVWVVANNVISDASVEISLSHRLLLQLP